MSTALKTFISRFVTLPEDELEEIAGRFKRKVVKKNEYIFRQGDTSRDFIFVDKGCLRLYYVKDGVEISVWFAFHPSSAIEVFSFISEQPSNYFMQAIEDSEVLILSKAELKKLYKTHPGMNEMMRNFWEAVLLDLISRFTAMETDSAEKRYMDLLNNTNYLERLPQKYLASFIGVTPTSLSRIRKKIRKDP